MVTDASISPMSMVARNASSRQKCSSSFPIRRLDGKPNSLPAEGGQSLGAADIDGDCISDFVIPFARPASASLCSI
jgi:hypothetical protein